MKDRLKTGMQSLHAMMAEMGALCQTALASAMKALLDGDAEGARQAAELETELNRRERDIEEACYDLMLRHQPVGQDLRHISAALKMIGEMERIGDQAADIAELAELGNVAPEYGCVVQELARAGARMMGECLEAYLRQDAILARQVMDREGEAVVNLFHTARQELAILLITQPDCAEGVMDLMMVSKYLERIGGHAANMAGWVVFAATGQYARPETQGRSPCPQSTWWKTKQISVS